MNGERVLDVVGIKKWMEIIYVWGMLIDEEVKARGWRT